MAVCPPWPPTAWRDDGAIKRLSKNGFLNRLATNTICRAIQKAEDERREHAEGKVVGRLVAGLPVKPSGSYLSSIRGRERRAEERLRALSVRRAAEAI